MKRYICLFFGLIVMITACSTRQAIDNLAGSTEQRLITHSIDKLMKALPEDDFNKLADKNVYFESQFIKADALTDYANSRFLVELEQNFNCTIVKQRDEADFNVKVFFTSLGTDQDSAGFTIPPFSIPGISGSVKIDLLALDMYHGISELYYYIFDNTSKIGLRGEKIKAVIRTDKLATPIISIPISTLK